MASVYQRTGRPGWYIDYTDALDVNHTNVPITARTKGEAERFKAELERTIERQKYGLDPLPVTSSMTLAQLCEWWLKDVCPAAAEKKERSRLKVEVLETELGQVHLHQLDDAALERQFAAMEKRDPPAAPGTVNRLRSTLGSIFYKAHKLKKWTGTNPVPAPTRASRRRAPTSRCGPSRSPWSCASSRPGGATCSPPRSTWRSGRASSSRCSRPTSTWSTAS
jgi:hypothetical protein